MNNVYFRVVYPSFFLTFPSYERGYAAHQQGHTPMYAAALCCQNKLLFSFSLPFVFSYIPLVMTGSVLPTKKYCVQTIHKRRPFVFVCVVLLYLLHNVSFWYVYTLRTHPPFLLLQRTLSCPIFPWHERGIICCPRTLYVATIPFANAHLLYWYVEGLRCPKTFFFCVYSL